MTEQTNRQKIAADGIMAPLRYTVFRRIWLASLLSNLGLLIQGVGAAWQSSVSEQVPPDALPSAVALNGISYNIARSFGPAVGGVIVAALGAVAAFACNAILYLPLLVVLLLWRRNTEPSRLPREKLNRAMVSGFRYISNSPSI